MTNLTFASDELDCISWKYAAEESLPSLRHTNDVIEAYVTAGPRIHLYRYLDRLQDNAIYCNNNSLIYIRPRDETRAYRNGGQIGDMTSELRPTDFVSEFVSGGPKILAYILIDIVTGRTDTVCKFRSITPNYIASQWVNFEVITT